MSVSRGAQKRKSLTRRHHRLRRIGARIKLSRSLI
jgi:hypothetical protein